MPFIRGALTLLAAVTAHAQTQLSLLCNSDFSSANATSNITSMNFNTADVSIHSWAVTVASPSSEPDGSEVETSVWYDPGFGEYTNNSALGYDLCAFVVANLPDNTKRLGQSDAGASRSAMVPRRCQDALRARASAEAQRLTGDVKNIPANVTEVCKSIARSFGDSAGMWPGECRKAFGQGREEDDAYASAPVRSMAITGWTTSGLTPDCKINGGGKNFDKVSLTPANEVPYDEATRTSWPILSVYMPVALADKNLTKQSISNLYTSLNCLRPNRFARGSRVSPELPQGTPLASGGLRVARVADVRIAAAAGVVLALNLW